MPQGYTESPTVFTEELSRNLESLIPPKGSILIQYVDDLLICSPDKASCEADTRALLNFLAENGHKVSKNKLQLVKQEVRYLGHLIAANGRALGLERIEAIRNIPKPITKSQMMTFLGVTGYCRPWIQDYAEISNPLLMAAHEVKKMTDLITWTDERHIAYEKLKLSLTTAPSLGLADYTKVFELFVSEKKEFMSAVLTQPHGDRRRPIAYFSKRLETVARGMTQCLRSYCHHGRSFISVFRFGGFPSINCVCSSCSTRFVIAVKDSSSDSCTFTALAKRPAHNVKCHIEKMHQVKPVDTTSH